VKRVTAEAARPFAGLRMTFVLNWASLGGAERRALTVGHWLSEREGAEVEVLARTEERGHAIELAGELGIPWRTVSIGWDGGKAAKTKDVARLARALRRGKPDVLLPFCSFPNVLCGLLWKRSGAATCLWHQADVSPFTRVRPSTRARAVRRTPVFVSNSKHGAEHLVREWGADPERIHVVRAGMELPRPELGREEWRARLDLAPEDFVACMVAHFRKSKDHATLLRAWRIVVDRLAESGRRAVLLLAGEAYPMEDAAKALGFDLRLESSVRFLGVVSDVKGLVNAADLGVLSSFREGFPVSLLEVMASGLPVVGTDIAGIREAVGHDGLAYLAPVGDAEALADAILRLARDEGLRRTLGDAYRARVLTDFSIEKMEKAYSDVLVHALQNGPR
jgi:glycosyltransferase involved in cell wall biosynthesis